MGHIIDKGFVPIEGYFGFFFAFFLFFGGIVGGILTGEVVDVVVF
jgi:hypothetical protein